ncbi:MAG: hypothetical protein ACOCUJ_03530, partial [Thiohalospira sp.]
MIADPMHTEDRRSAIDRLKARLEDLRASTLEQEGFGEFECQVHQAFVEAEREVLAEGLAHYDVDRPFIEANGQVYRRAQCWEKSYLSAVGEIRVERTLYRTGEAGEASVCPLEWRAGVIEGYWTPAAAKQGAWVMAHLTAQEAEGLFAQLGNMSPSKSSLDRLPKALSAHWEAEREPFEASL